MKGDGAVSAAVPTMHGGRTFRSSSAPSETSFSRSSATRRRNPLTRRSSASCALSRARLFSSCGPESPAGRGRENVVEEAAFGPPSRTQYRTNNQSTTRSPVRTSGRPRRRRPPQPWLQAVARARAIRCCSRWMDTAIALSANKEQRSVMSRGMRDPGRAGKCS